MILVHQCPHCLTERMALDLVSENQTLDTRKRAVSLFCRKCHNPSSAMLLFTGTLPHHHVAPLMPAHLPANSDPQNHEWTVVDFWPKLPVPTIPADLPAEVARAYLQAERSFQMEDMEEPAAGMYRRALEIGISVFDSTPVGNLKGRIDKLAASHKIAPDVAEWAHGVRLGGNDAMHDPDPISRRELVALRGLAEMVLTYLFTMPAMLAARKKESELPPKEDAPA